MAEIKGKFILLTANLMSLYEDKLEKADQHLHSKTGKHWNELDPEGWYDTELYRFFISSYVEGSPSKEEAMVTLGKLIYPTIKKTVGFPPGLKTPIDYIEFESNGYTENIRGPQIRPRKFLQKENGNVIVELRMEEQDCKVLEGVYLGILAMAGVPGGKVEQKKCIKNGDPACEFHVTW
jgi:hypothetical protein